MYVDITLVNKMSFNQLDSLSACGLFSNDISVDNRNIRYYCYCGIDGNMTYISKLLHYGGERDSITMITMVSI